MVTVRFHPTFRKEMKKADEQTRMRVLKQIAKIAQQPDVGKPMRYNRKGTREVYVPPYRLSYIHEAGMIKVIALYHKDEQ